MSDRESRKSSYSAALAIPMRRALAVRPSESSTSSEAPWHDLPIILCMTRCAATQRSRGENATNFCVSPPAVPPATRNPTTSTSMTAQQAHIAYFISAWLCLLLSVVLRFSLSTFSRYIFFKYPGYWHSAFDRKHPASSMSGPKCLHSHGPPSLITFHALPLVQDFPYQYAFGCRRRTVRVDVTAGTAATVRPAPSGCRLASGS